jgi:hypothetical protein
MGKMKKIMEAKERLETEMLIEDYNELCLSEEEEIREGRECMVCQEEIPLYEQLASIELCGYCLHISEKIKDDRC